MWVAMRSRNQRSWLITTAQPAKPSRASSSARSVSTSRSLVGSSSSSRLPPLLSSLARCSRFRSPPERMPTFFCWSAPRKSNPAAVGAGVDAPRAEHRACPGRRRSPGTRVLLRIERLAATGPRRRPAPSGPTISVAAVRLLLPDDHPEERGLAGAVRADHADDAAARQREVQILEQQPVAVTLGRASFGDHDLVAEARRRGGIRISAVPSCASRSSAHQRPRRR